MRTRVWLLWLPAFFVACGSTERFLRPEPALHVNSAAQVQLVLPDEIKDTIKIRCIGKRKVVYTDGASGVPQCLYLSADITNVMQKISAFQKKENRDLLTSVLVSISDQNCQTFLGRAFANKAGVDTSRNIISDLATGAAAGTAAANPAISAGLSVSNLIVSKTTENLDKTYYAEKTFQAMESLILGERASLKAQIIANMAKAPSAYSVFDAVSEVRRYDEACSIRHGLLKLADVAQESRSAGEAELTTAIARQ